MKSSKSVTFTFIDYVGQKIQIFCELMGTQNVLYPVAALTGWTQYEINGLKFLLTAYYDMWSF